MIVLSDRGWRERFGADPTVVGRGIVVDGAPYEIIGVARPGFYFPERDTLLWTPMEVRRPAPDAVAGGRGVMGVIDALARLRPGATPEQAEIEGTAAARTMIRPMAANLLFGAGNSLRRSQGPSESRRIAGRAGAPQGSLGRWSRTGLPRVGGRAREAVRALTASVPARSIRMMTMKNDTLRLPFARRSFLSKLGAALTAAGATLSARAAGAQAPPDDAPWLPARHAQDDWLDVPSRHRLYFDVTHPDTIQNVMLFASNFINVNKDTYEVGSGDLSVVIGVRHDATPLGYGDAIWAKYGAILAERTGLVDPATKQAPTTNIYAPAKPPARGNTFTRLGGLGVRFTVCAVSSRGIAGMIARRTGGDADAVFKEISANLIDRARLVPAGIVAVTRAQEHGYTVV